MNTINTETKKRELVYKPGDLLIDPEDNEIFILAETGDFHYICISLVNGISYDEPRPSIGDAIGDLKYFGSDATIKIILE